MKYYSDYNKFIKKINEVILKNKTCNISGIGIGAPNGNYYKGTIENPANLKWKGKIEIVKNLKMFFPNVDICLTNDANSAAIGEIKFGKAKGVKDFMMITIGTGLGSGIVVDGKIVYGNDGFAGEIGHTIYKLNGRKCGCGRRGCLEAYVSASGIVKTARQLLKSKKDKSILRNQKVLTSKIIGESANKGDKIAIETFDKTAKILAIKLADSVLYTSPAVIYLFGGVTQVGDILLKPLQKYFNDYVLQIYKNKIKICFSGLSENDAAILGAVSLVKK
jgi:glucokinase